MPLIRGHHRRDRRYLDDVVPPRRGIVARYGRVALGALLRLAHHHLIDCLDEE
jgi:hypothetical protein